MIMIVASIAFVIITLIPRTVKYFKSIKISKNIHKNKDKIDDKTEDFTSDLMVISFIDFLVLLCAWGVGLAMMRIFSETLPLANIKTNNTVHTDIVQIASIDLHDKIQGNFTLGSGSIDDTSYYYYYRKDGDYYTKGKVPDNEKTTKLIEDNKNELEIRKITIENSLQSFKSNILNDLFPFKILKAFFYNREKSTQYILHVPKGTIISSYKVQ